MTRGIQRPTIPPLAARLRRALARFAPRLFLRLADPSPAELGAAGEELAARWLLRHGWRLRGRRVTTPPGEVDLWAERGGLCWVVEVKTGRLDRLPPLRGHAALPRWDLRWRPARRVDRAQLERLFRAARHLARKGGRDCAVVVIEVLVARDGKVVEVLTPIPLSLEFPPLLADPPR